MQAGREQEGRSNAHAGEVSHALVDVAIWRAGVAPAGGDRPCQQVGARVEGL